MTRRACRRRCSSELADGRVAQHRPPAHIGLQEAQLRFLLRCKGHFLRFRLTLRRRWHTIVDLTKEASMVDAQPSEHGAKWWIRYVVIPLVGTGGVTAVVVGLLSRPSAVVSPMPAQAVPAAAAVGLSPASAAAATAVTPAPSDVVNVEQKVERAKRDVTGLNARNADNRVPKSIDVTQQIGTAEGTVTGVDLSTTSESKK